MSKKSKDKLINQLDKSGIMQTGLSVAPMYADFNHYLELLPNRMYQRRMKMPTRKGYLPGLRGAAKEIGISTTTYQRYERGSIQDVDTLIKIMAWIEEDIS